MEEQKDLFEFYEEMPRNLSAICGRWSNKHVEEDLTYQDCAEFLAEVRSIGYTFEYGLDAQPYNLTLIESTNG